MTAPIKCFYIDHGYDSWVGGPCCFQPTQGATSFASMHNNPTFIEIKNSFDKGIWPEEYCQVCKRIEDLNDPTAISKRQAYPYFGDSLQTVVIDTGRLCNIQCRSCNPIASSSWIKEKREMPDSIRRMSLDKLNINVFPHTPYNWQSENFSGVRHMQFLGGEPMYNPDALLILKKLYRETNGFCEISFTSNGTIKLDYEHNRWLEKFKTINIVLSLDAIGSAAEYIRTGCNWDTILKNIEFYRTKSNTLLKYHPCYSVLNIFEARKLFDWGEEQGIELVKETTFVEDPNFLSFEILKDNEKQTVIDYFTANNLYFLATRVKQSTFSPDARKQFFIFMDHTTAYHNMNWKDYLPELYNLIGTE